MNSIVAQSCTLLYRRIAFGRASEKAGALEVPPNALLALFLLLGEATPTFAANTPLTQASAFRFVDLSSAAAASEVAARQFSALPAGVQTFHGIPFRIDSRLAVTGIESARAGDFFPTEVTGIKLGGNVKRLHLLHGTMFADKDGVPVAKIVFHYANGGEESVRPSRSR